MQFAEKFRVPTFETRHQKTAIIDKDSYLEQTKANIDIKTARIDNTKGSHLYFQ